jgi:hypothetical protein
MPSHGQYERLQRIGISHTLGEQLLSPHEGSGNHGKSRPHRTHAAGKDEGSS